MASFGKIEVKSTDPNDHIGHEIVVDRYGLAYGRSVRGDGWCSKCRCRVALLVYEPGIFEGFEEKTDGCSDRGGVAGKATPIFRVGG